MSKIIGDYILLEEIGSGQYGKVWKAEHINTKQKYAIKVINRMKILSQDKLKDFLDNEISCLELVRSNNIVRYYGKEQTSNNYYLIFEYCKNGTLEQMIKSRSPFDEHYSLNILDQLLLAFYELYKMNIIHRDLKPSNILIDDDSIKLADFGFSKKLRGEFDLAKSIVGSPIYMAPELLQGKHYCKKADIWSLGIVLYEMLHGRCPYEEHTMNSLLDKIQNIPLKINDNISVDTTKLIKSMLTIDPYYRISWTDLFKRINTSYNHDTSNTNTLSNNSVGISSEPKLPFAYVNNDSHDINRRIYNKHRPYNHRFDILNNTHTHLIKKHASVIDSISHIDTVYKKDTVITIHDSDNNTDNRCTDDNEAYRPIACSSRYDNTIGDRYIDRLLYSIYSSGMMSDESYISMHDIYRYNRQYDNIDMYDIMRYRYIIRYIMSSIEYMYDNSVIYNDMIIYMMTCIRKYYLSLSIKSRIYDEIYSIIHDESMIFDSIHQQYIIDNDDSIYNTYDIHHIVYTVNSMIDRDDIHVYRVCNSILDVYMIDEHMVYLMNYTTNTTHIHADYTSYILTLQSHHLLSLINIKINLLSNNNY